MNTRAVIRKVGVLGAGNMGSQIAAHVAGAGFPVVLLDVETPAELNDPDINGRVTRGTFAHDLQVLAECDWIIEAVTESFDIKRALLSKASGVRQEGAIISSNTSGISIRELAAGMPVEFRRHWLGTHFFNPPRYMRLLELIPTEETDQGVVQTIANFADISLGKTVVRAKDTPNFIGNRLWMFVALTTIRVMQELGLTIEEIDALTGVPLGWPKTGTFRLSDLIGLDVVAHMSERADLPLPEFVKEMVNRGWIGDKAGQGFYKKPGLALDWQTLEYRPSQTPHIAIPPKLSSPQDLRHLLEGDTKTASFYRALLPDLWNYVSSKIPEIADDVVSIDQAMKAGYNWHLGPFEMWDAAGHAPAWYNGGQFLDPLTNQYKPVPVLPGASSVAAYRKQHGVLRENSSVSFIDLGSRIGCLEFHTKMNALDTDILTLSNEILENDDGRFDAIVLGSDAPNFSAGANLLRFLNAIQAKDWKLLDNIIKEIQHLTQSIKFSRRPVIAALVGHTLGGGAEVALHAAKRQAHFDLRMGLVETAVGLVPAGGGCKEMVLRSTNITQTFINIVTAKTSKSASDAKRLNYLSADDDVTMNRARLLEDAKRKAILLAEASYQPPVPRTDIPASQLGPIDLQITGHDATVATHIAAILTGGGVPPGTLLTEQHFLDLEREAFLSLCGEKKTEERIAHMLKTGKPLKN